MISKGEGVREANRYCPICNASRVVPLHTQRFELPSDHPLAEGYDVVACPQCGFVYADTPVKQTAYTLYYTEFSQYEDKNHGTGGGDNAIDHIRLENTAHQIAGFLHNPSARILDVGCANGGLLKALKDTGFTNLCGLDPSKACVDTTRAAGFEAHTGSIVKDFPYGPFDCIIFSHTLEHVVDVHATVEWISGLLKPDGARTAYIEVPDASRYADFLYSPFQEFNIEHINHFSRKCLANAMGLSGFLTVESGEKLLSITPEFLYPTLFGFWQKKGDSKKVALEPDMHLITRMGEYIQRSQLLMDEFRSSLLALLPRRRRVIVWGTGQLAMKLLAETSLGDVDIAAFIDSNAINHGRTLRGVEILAPQKLVGRTEPILIATVLHRNAIKLQIQSMGLTNDILMLLE